MPSAIDVNAEFGQEPLDLFRQYLSPFAKEQAFCHFSDGLSFEILNGTGTRNSRTTK